MTHRAETITAAVVTAVTGLATTGTRVERARMYPVGTYPALSVRMGQDVPIGERGQSNTGRIDRELDVMITSHVRSTTLTGNNDATLNTIRAEVYAALSADYTLGLAYVVDCWPIGDDEPEDEADSEQIVSRQDLRWRVHYFHSLTSAEA